MASFPEFPSAESVLQVEDLFDLTSWILDHGLDSKPQPTPHEPLPTTIDPRALCSGFDGSPESYYRPLPSGGSGCAVPHVTAFGGLEDCIFARVPFDVCPSSPSDTTNTPHLTPDTEALDLPSSDEDVQESLSPVPTWIELCSRSLRISSETPSPTASTSELAASPSTPGSSQDSSEDSDESSDDDSDSESEYTPSEYTSSPRLPPLKERRAYTNARSSRAPRSSASTSSSSSSSSSSPRAKRSPLSRRKEQSSPPSPKLPTSKSAAASLPRCTRSRSIQVPADFECPEPIDFRCPIPGCTHVQRNRRRPDLDRHIDAHYAKARKYWICCGVPVAQATHEYGVGDVRFWEETGRTMVGGCGMVLTRKDALKRHLSISECHGDEKGDWMPGNRRGC